MYPDPFHEVMQRVPILPNETDPRGSGSTTLLDELDTQRYSGCDGAQLWGAAANGSPGPTPQPRPLLPLHLQGYTNNRPILHAVF